MTTKLEAARAIRRRTDRFISTFVLMSDAQWRYRPAPGAWSVSEVVEHVAIANGNMLDRLTKRLTTPLSAPLGVADDEIPYLFYGGDEPPNVATPTGTWMNIAEAAETFDDAASALISWADRTDLDLRTYGAAHPIFGVLDGLQWLLFAGAHTERHRRQLLGYQRRPDFPTKSAT